MHACIQGMHAILLEHVRVLHASPIYLYSNLETRSSSLVTIDLVDYLTLPS
jgi:hypothetical protein